MIPADRLDRYRARDLLLELERLAQREREVREELRDILTPRAAPFGRASLRERFGGKPTST
jgi:hypothetical protein